VLGGVHCGIHKSSYSISNISYLNSPPPPFFLAPLPHSWNSFNRYHFSICTHVYTLFALYSRSHTLSPTPPLSHLYQPPQTGPVLQGDHLLRLKKLEESLLKRQNLIFTLHECQESLQKQKRAIREKPNFPSSVKYVCSVCCWSLKQGPMYAKQLLLLSYISSPFFLYREERFICLNRT
jgi:hypothetical protein